MHLLNNTNRPPKAPSGELEGGTNRNLQHLHPRNPSNPSKPASSALRTATQALTVNPKP